jgi:CheY-like chemotaxis protein
MILTPLSLRELLDLKIVVPSPSLIQVGTFLATDYFEEGKPMTDSHFSASNRTIMVVDDNPDIVDILRITLESNGFNVRCAYSGLEVLTQLKEDPSMPFIPVILLSAKVLDEDVLRGYKMGAEYYITKPFTPTQVLDGINLFLGRDQGRSVESL